MPYSLVIADDVRITRNSLTESIDWGSLGFHVQASFSDGAQVIDYLKSNPLDALLIDLKMIRVSGLEVAAYIHSHSLPTKVVHATYTQSDKEFDRQLNEAINGITAIEEITSQQKDYLVALMNEAKSSVDESQKQVCKGKFDAFMLGIGDVSVKVISVLSGLSSIARFFGLGA